MIVWCAAIYSGVGFGFSYGLYYDRFAYWVIFPVRPLDNQMTLLVPLFKPYAPSVGLFLLYNLVVAVCGFISDGPVTPTGLQLF